MGGQRPEPGDADGWAADHAGLLRASLRHWTGRDLLGSSASEGPEAGRLLFHAPFAVLSHGLGPDPVFTYANRTALDLFAMTWTEMLATPSRLSAQAPERDERARLLAAVHAQGFVDDYAGVRVTREGRRFSIRRATVWNLVGPGGRPEGQAAMFADWDWLDRP